MRYVQQSNNNEEKIWILNLIIASDDKKRASWQTSTQPITRQQTAQLIIN